MRRTRPLPALCRQVADASDAADPAGFAQALAALYVHLAERGWRPPDRARAVMHYEGVSTAHALEVWLGEVLPAVRPESQEPDSG